MFYAGVWRERGNFPGKVSSCCILCYMRLLFVQRWFQRCVIEQEISVASAFFDLTNGLCHAPCVAQLRFRVAEHTIHDGAMVPEGGLEFRVPAGHAAAVTPLPFFDHRSIRQTHGKHPCLLHQSTGDADDFLDGMEKRVVLLTNAEKQYLAAQRVQRAEAAFRMCGGAAFPIVPANVVLGATWRSRGRAIEYGDGVRGMAGTMRKRMIGGDRGQYASAPSSHAPIFFSDVCTMTGRFCGACMR